jgi:hypothetical protein
MQRHMFRSVTNWLCRFPTVSIQTAGVERGKFKWWTPEVKVIMPIKIVTSQPKFRLYS